LGGIYDTPKHLCNTLLAADPALLSVYITLGPLCESLKEKGADLPHRLLEMLPGEPTGVFACTCVYVCKPL
jgi:hypothetical protein